MDNAPRPTDHPNVSPRSPVAVRRPTFAVGLLIALLVPFLLPQSAVSAPPPGFTDEPVADVEGPTALAFTPDGRLLITSKPGRLLVLQPGSATPTVALDISSKVCANSERGLLGVAVDPAFAANGFVYLYYTRQRGDGCPEIGGQGTLPVNHVSRFTMTGDTVAPTPETTLLTNIPSPGGNHNAGDLQFGKDGFLYVSVGDGSIEDNAPRLNSVSGKILRITSDGAIPRTNPYRAANSRRCAMTGRTTRGNICQEIFARGLRNPFRMAFDPDAAATRFFINDVGANTWEEVNVGQRGANYGWPRREGPCAFGETQRCGAPPRGITNPIDAYRHTTGCRSITGGAFVPNDAWPSQPDYTDAYLYADFVCNTIFALEPRPSGGGFTRSVFYDDMPGKPVALAFGPGGTGQALYYAAYGGNGGEVRRIAPGTAAPTASPGGR